MFIDYEVSKDGQYFAEVLSLTARNGSLHRTSAGITVVGKGAKATSCNIGGVIFDPTMVASNPIVVSTTGMNVGCEKSGEKGVSTAFQTSVAGVPFIHLPSVKAIAAGEFDTLKYELEALRTIIGPLESQLSRLAASVATVDANKISGDQALIQAIRGLDVEYLCHLSGLGARTQRNFGFCGTSGEGRKMEGISIKIIGKP